MKKCIAISFALLVLVSCTYVPFDAARQHSVALSSAGTQAERIAAELRGQNAEAVAMAPLFDGNDALGARLRMIATAERSIDLQTFLIKPDLAGSLIWLALYSAAERGVKIRLLYDDVFTTAQDKDISSLDAHPNVEIRVFNPLSRNSGTAVNFMFDFSRVNRRMHNKAMITDGSFAIVGGRNIADEYFSIGTKHDFADFDLFVAGKAVKELSKAFDAYWNDPWSLPLAVFDKGDDTPLQEAYEAFQDRTLTEATSIYDRAVNSKYLAQLRSGQEPYYPGTARVVVDDVHKLRTPPGTGPFTVGDTFYQTLKRALTSVTVVTPYFIPENYGAAVFEKLVQKGVEVTILTNSLASTNHTYTHGHYARYRKRLMESGVRFAEVRADSPLIVEGTDAPLTMHSKLAIVDDRMLFVGSANIDPRSIRQNSEIGLVIHSPSLAKEISNQLDAALPEYTYNLGQSERGGTMWEYNGSTERAVYQSEPAAGFWRKLVATVSGWLPIEQQL
ncbi:MAG: phospholipase D family protein [Ruegeria sp.]